MKQLKDRSKYVTLKSKEGKNDFFKVMSFLKETYEKILAEGGDDIFIYGSNFDFRYVSLETNAEESARESKLKLEEKLEKTNKDLANMKKEKEALIKSIEIEEKRVQCLRDEIETKREW